MDTDKMQCMVSSANQSIDGLMTGIYDTAKYTTPYDGILVDELNLLGGAAYFPYEELLEIRQQAQEKSGEECEQEWNDFLSALDEKMSYCCTQGFSMGNKSTDSKTNPSESHDFPPISPTAPGLTPEQVSRLEVLTQQIQAALYTKAFQHGNNTRLGRYCFCNE